MEFIDERLLDYCERFTSNEPDLLKHLNRETHLKVNKARMLSGHLQGRLLSFLSKMHNPALILEIGTYTGYSALCLAEGLKENGKLITIDPNAETNHFAQLAFDRSEYKNKIALLCGQAHQLIPTFTHNFDLVFIDADKKNNGLYFDLVIERVNKGGLIIADNVLWNGKVIEDQKNKDTQLVHAFNQKIKEDARVEKIVLPIRDGLTLMRKL